MSAADGVGSGRDVVLTVGVERPTRQPRLPPVHHAASDARALAGLFGRLGVPADRIHTLTGSQATAETVRSRLTRMPDHGDRFWFAFIGHAITTGDHRTHLLIHDTESGHRARPEHSLTVEDVIGMLPGDRILLLDLDHRAPAQPDVHDRPGLGLFTAAVIDILGGAYRPITVADLENRLLTLPARPYGARLEVEPSWRAAAMVLFPHLLTGDDLRTLRHRAISAPPACGAALWRTLAALVPDDPDAQLLAAHFEALATTNVSALLS